VIVMLICGAGLAGLWYQFLTPIEEQIAAKNLQVGDLEAQVARSLQQKLVFEQFKKDVIELGRQLDGLKSVLPLEKETPEIMRTVETGVRTSGLRVLRIVLRPTVDHEVYTEWPWDLEIVGTYHNLESFLDKVRQLPRIVNISNVRMSTRAADGELAFTSSVGATFSATTFIYHEEPIATAAPPPKPSR
jgi:type IV pilus assembly protein PilO